MSQGRPPEIDTMPIPPVEAAEAPPRRPP